MFLSLDKSQRAVIHNCIAFCANCEELQGKLLQEQAKLFLCAYLEKNLQSWRDELSYDQEQRSLNREREAILYDRKGYSDSSNF